jgi:hypothetical protein
LSIEDTNAFAWSVETRGGRGGMFGSIYTRARSSKCLLQRRHNVFRSSHCNSVQPNRLREAGIREFGQILRGGKFGLSLLFLPPHTVLHNPLMLVQRIPTSSCLLSPSGHEQIQPAGTVSFVPLQSKITFGDFGSRFADLDYVELHGRFVSRYGLGSSHLVMDFLCPIT